MWCQHPGLVGTGGARSVIVRISLLITKTSIVVHNERPDPDFLTIRVSAKEVQEVMDEVLTDYIVENTLYLNGCADKPCRRPKNIEQKIAQKRNLLNANWSRLEGN